MHPFRTGETFVRNSWYVACAAEDVSNKPFERVILGHPVAFYRAANGKAMAMHGICPHRFYPLALHGKVVGDALACNYHGFAYDGRTGACVRVPSQRSVPNFRQRIYPVVERHPWIWIWPGDPALADETRIPTHEEIGFGTGWTHLKPFSFLSIKARYMFLVENLLDLTHLGYLHGDMGDFSLYVQSPMEIDETADRLRVVRPMRDGWTQQHEVMFGAENRFEGLSDFASITNYYGPGYVTTTGHITSAIDSLPVVDKTIYGDVIFHHAVTPETAHTCHYFGTSSRTHRLTDKAFDELFYPFDETVRRQDIEAAEAIEAKMIQFGEPSTELLVKSDAAAGRIRRKIQRAIDEEGGSAALSALA
jgi:phenylpropionate dioxygenase-like ring-hydroxylating dioxygenase large terminal subunit